MGTGDGLGVPKAGRVFAQNVREWRLRQGKTIRELAFLARVSKSTVVRVEAGEPCRRATAERIAAALGTAADRLALERHEALGAYSVYRPDHTPWAFLAEQRPVADGDALIQSAAERRRLGDGGLVAMLAKRFDCGLEGGRLVAGVIEVYRRHRAAHALRAEELLLYVLRGRLRVLPGDAAFELDEGEAAVVRGGRPVDYEPATPRKRGDPPVLALYVALNA